MSYFANIGGQVWTEILQIFAQIELVVETNRVLLQLGPGLDPEQLSIMVK